MKKNYRKYYTSIPIKEGTRTSLKVLLVVSGKKSYDELLRDMIDVYCKAKRIKIKVESQNV